MHSCLGSNCNKELNWLHGKALEVLLGVVHMVVAEVMVMVYGVGLIKDLQNPFQLVLEMHHCYCSNNNNGQAKWLVNNMVQMQIEIALGDKNRMLEKGHSKQLAVCIWHTWLLMTLIQEQNNKKRKISSMKIGNQRSFLENTN